MPEKPGIIFVPWLLDGGIERVLEIKAPWFANRGHRVHVLAWEVARIRSRRADEVGRPDRHAHLERDLTEEVGRCLHEYRGRPLCHTCLAAAVGTKFEQAWKAVYVLRFTGDARVGASRCSVCGQQRVTIETAEPRT